MRVACLFIPHFLVAVERLQRPELKNQPVIVGGAPEERKVVLDCSPEAIQRGVRPAMSLREALGRCREAAFLEGHHVLYRETAAVMERALGQISPLVESVVLGQVFVGLKGLERSYPAETPLAKILAQSVEQAIKIKPRVGVADGKFAAYAAALFSSPGKPRLIPSREAPDFLAKLPVIYLPISDEMRERLRLLGLRTIGDLAALPLGAVQAEFGPEGRLAWELAHGIDDSNLLAQDFPTDLSDQLSFPAPVANSEALLAGIRHLLFRLIKRKEFRYRAARGLTIRVIMTNGHTWERQLTFREPLADRDRMLLALRGKLGELVLSSPAEVIELVLSGLCPEGGFQGDLFISERVHQESRLAEAVRQLKAHYGYTPIFKVMEVEPWSRLPERRLALIDYDP